MYESCHDYGSVATSNTSQSRHTPRHEQECLSLAFKLYPLYAIYGVAFLAGTFGTYFSILLIRVLTLIASWAVEGFTKKTSG